MTAATPWTLTRLAPGAYLSRTPVDDRPFLLLSYYEDGSASDPDGRIVKGTRWCVIEFDDEDGLARAADRARYDWFDVFALDETDGVTLASTNHRTRYAARAWAETNLDRTPARDRRDP